MFGNIQQIPTFAKVVIAICIVVFLLTAIDVVPLRKLCLNEVISVYLLHWSRLHQLLTSHFAHVGFFHIFFNLSAYVGFGADFERKLGSALCAYFTVVLCVTASILHLIFAYVIMWLPLSSSAPISQYFLIVPPVGCSVGLSSLLFALIVIR
jgi:membrane associated rhomboid family serine protease